jgi:C4-dicarboxylate transporter DctM subunit
MNPAIVLILLFLVLVLAGLPIAFSFGVSSLIFLLMGMGGNYTIMISRTFGGVDVFALMAVPFFIYAGDVMKEGGLSRSLINVANKLVGKVKGGIGNVCIVACAFFGAISGSSAATVAAIGGIMIPEMEKWGYEKNYAVALAASAGFLGIMIPPSVPLIIYGLNAQVSVADLFLASVLPGVLMMSLFMVVNYYMVGKYSRRVSLDKTVEGQQEKQKSVIPAILMPVIILGGIYGGICTPTEAGAVAVIYSIMLSAFYYKSLKIKKFLDITTGSATTSAVILVIIAFASVFGWIMTTEQLPTLLRDMVTSVTMNKYVILFILNVFYLILGTFMETVTIIVITTPLFLPLVTSVGVDPIHFGIIQQTNLCVGLITPPMALNLLIACKIGSIKVEQVLKPLIPFLIAAIVVTLIVTYVPVLSMALPELFMK